jgi:thiamine biosynthesis lipoprotein
MTTVLPRRAWVEQIMGLPVSVHVRGPDPSQASSRVAALFADLRRADEVFSPYREGSDLSRWERGELALADTDPLLAHVFELCDEARERTAGWFDPRRLPDPVTGSSRYNPSGLVKGWAVQRAAERLQDLPGYGWCVNAGGDVVLQAPDDQPAWRVGVEDPADPRAILRVVARRTGGVATSGSAHRGAHIIDPHTGQPATGVRSVTVVGPDLMWADVYATAAAAWGPWALDWLETLAGYAALVVSASGRQQATGNWAKLAG